jgi:hypothetical protein
MRELRLNLRIIILEYFTFSLPDYIEKCVVMREFRLNLRKYNTKIF